MDEVSWEDVGWLKVAEVMFQWQVMNLEGHEKQHTS
jgi:hypothetical protein